MKDNIGLMPRPTKSKDMDGNLGDEQLKIINEFKEYVENGDIQSFIAFGLDHDGNIVMASQVNSIIDGVGLIEVGKLTFMNNYAKEEH